MCENSASGERAHERLFVPLIILLMVCLISLVPIFLFQGALRFYFYLVGVLLAVSVIICLSDGELHFRINIAGLIGNARFVIGVLQVILSLLLVFTTYVTYPLSDYVVLTVIMLLAGFLSGYVLLALLNVDIYFSRLELLPMSYLVGYSFSWILFYPLIFLGGQLRAGVIVLLYLCLGLGLIGKSLLVRCSAKVPAKQSLSQHKDFLVLAVILISYILFYSFTYPGISYAPGTDMSRHYNWSIVLSRTPELYLTTTYLAFHLFYGLLLTFSKLGGFYVTTAQVLFNLIMPISFYALAKSYLERIDKRLPVVSTAIFSMFSGLSWIYLAKLRLNGTPGTELDLLNSVNLGAWAGAANTMLPIFWYVPISVSTTIFLVQLFLLRKLEIPRRVFVFLFSIISISSLLTHTSESVLFTGVLAFYGLVKRDKENLRIDDALIALILSFVLGQGVYLSLIPVLKRGFYSQVFIVSNMSLLCAFVTYAYRSTILSKKITIKLNHTLKKTAYFVRDSLPLSVLFGLCALYVVGLLTWSSIAQSFDSWEVIAVGIVPWYMYPLILGTAGSLCTVGLMMIFRERLMMDSLRFVVFGLAIFFVGGRFLSYVNLYIPTLYYEKRFSSLVFILGCMIAAIPVVETYAYGGGKSRSGGRRFTRRFLAAILIGIIVFSGVQTTFMAVYYQNLEFSSGSSGRASPAEIGAIEHLKVMFDKDPFAWFASVTGLSSGFSGYAAPADSLGMTSGLYGNLRPEMVFSNLFRSPDYSHPYLYLHDRDIKYLQSYSDGFFVRHLLPLLPVVFKNSEVTIYNVSHVSPPSQVSNNILHVPYDNTLYNDDISYVFDLLSQGGYNYTVSYDLDDKSTDAKTILLPLDPSRLDFINTSFRGGFPDTRSWMPISGSWYVDNSELWGGGNASTDEGIIVSPILAENFHTRFTFKMVKIDPAVLNYIGLIYSWTDRNNYRYANVMFSTDGYIYLDIVDVNEGHVTSVPNWPGVNTNLRWSLNEEYRIDVNVNGSSNQLVINGGSPLSVKMRNIGGKIGLRYFRVESFAFDELAVSASFRVEHRPLNDYLDYMNSGGRLVVLNTNGFNYFANDMLDVSNVTIKAVNINGSNISIRLPKPVSMPKLVLRGSESTPLYYYNSPTDSSLYVVARSVGRGQLIYVNIYPIIDAMRSDREVRPLFYGILGKLLDGLPLDKAKPHEIELDGTVREIRLVNMSLHTDSVLFPTYGHTVFERVTVASKGNISVFNNVTEILLAKYSYVNVRSHTCLINDGEGFYSKLHLNGMTTFEPIGNTTSLTITSADGKFRFDQVSVFETETNRTAEVYVRTPRVIAEGSLFKELHPGDYLEEKNIAPGESLNVTGPIRFDISISDTYTFIKNVELASSYHYSPPRMSFDEWSTVPITIYWSLLLAVLLTIYLGTFLVRKEQERDRS